MATDEIPESWQAALGPVLATPQARQLGGFLVEEERAGIPIYPPRGCRLAALELTPLDAVKVVILGQDPYHGPGQAMGLCFAVPEGVKVPPSLVNIYKELEADLGIARPAHGDLSKWARQGVLLLNAVLTVQANEAGSHAKRGWEAFTTRIIEIAAQRHEHLVFMLWGSYAHKKAEQVDLSGHCVLKSAHPSPLSAHRGFIGNGHFSAANSYLQEHGRKPIDWCLPDTSV